MTVGFLFALALVAVGLAVVWLGARAPMFRVIPVEQTEWGALFAVVDGWGSRYFVGRYKVAHEQCAAMNGPQSKGGLQTGR